MTEKEPSLADLFKMIAEEKKKQEKIIKSPDDLKIDVSDAVNSIFEELSGKKPEPVVVPEPVILPEPIVEERSLVQEASNILSGDPSQKTNDPLSPLDQKFMTIEAFNKHYSTFIDRVQRQLSTLGGGGETKFRFLDDVKRNTMGASNDNWLLEYDAASKTVKFTNQLGPIDRINFDLTHTHDEERVVGTLCWSPEDQTLNIEHPGGVTQQVGQETYAYVRNRTGSTILNGTVVRFAGAEQNGTARLLVAPFLANDEYDTLFTLGIATQDIADSADGRITVWGKLRDVDTSAFNVGDILYVSPTTPGGLTNVKPTAPDNVVPIAAVLRKDSAEGEIFVRPTVEQERKYGNFYSDSDQTAALVNTPYAIRSPIRSFGKGFTVDSDNASLIAATSGLYNFNCNLQFISTNASQKDVWIWLRLNDSDIPKTTRKITIVGNNVATVVSAVHNVSMNSGDKVKHMWAASDVTIRLDAPAPTAFAPDTPSVIIDVTQAAL